MASPVCSLCSKKPHGKMASFYWARFNGGNDREAWKQRYCRECFGRVIEPWYEKVIALNGSDEADHCILCEQTDPGQLVSYYLTSYVPNEPMEREGISICLEHTQEVEPMLRRGAEVLIDRQRVEAEPSRARW